MLTMVMSVDRDFAPNGAPFNREEIALWLGHKVVIQGFRTYEMYGPLPGAYNCVIAKRAVRDVRTLDFESAITLSNMCDTYLIGGVHCFDVMLPHASVTWLDVWDRASPGYHVPTFSFHDWSIGSVTHHGSFSRYRLNRRKGMAA